MHAVNTECKGDFRAGKTILGGFIIDAAVCERCGETHTDPAQAQHVLAFRKLVNRDFEATVTSVGNSTAVRLPVEVARQMGLEPGQQINLRVTAPAQLGLSIPGMSIKPAFEKTVHVITVPEEQSQRSNAIGKAQVLPQAAIRGNRA